jgi:hypothetical protein
VDNLTRRRELSEYMITEDASDFLPRAVIKHTACGWLTPLPVDVSLAAILTLADSHDCDDYLPRSRRRWPR